MNKQKQGSISLLLKTKVPTTARIQVPMSANESSLAPSSVSHLNVRAINPSKTSVIRFTIKNIANKCSFPDVVSQRIYGKATNLQKERILGTVQISFFFIIGWYLVGKKNFLNVLWYRINRITENLDLKSYCKKLKFKHIQIFPNYEISIG